MLHGDMYSVNLMRDLRNRQFSNADIIDMEEFLRPVSCPRLVKRGVKYFFLIYALTALAPPV